MTFPINDKNMGRVSADYDDPRIWDGKEYFHGAWDVAVPYNTKILAPENGLLVYYIGNLPMNSGNWPKGEGPKINGKLFPWRNYSYNVFGAITVLYADSGRAHVFAHSYENQVFNKNPLHVKWKSCEESKEAPPVIKCQYTSPVRVKIGAHIGYVGSSGNSTGNHIHWEIHPKHERAGSKERLDPKEFFPKYHDKYFKE